MGATMMRRKRLQYTTLAYTLAIALSGIVFGFWQGLGLFVILMLFGWGMNLESRR